MKKRLKNFTGFTLAEVLIALTVIGVIAAITISGLVNTINDMHYKATYKKAVADATNAVDNANRQYLFESADCSINNFAVFMHQFKTIKECTSGSDGRDICWEFTNGEKYGSWHSPYSNSYQFIDTSGRAWSMPYSSTDAYFFVDTNGSKNPNQWGKDRFALWFKQTSTGSGIITINPFINNSGNICITENKCSTEQNYYGTSWLLN